jgi:uncharacterized membrane protein (UPF0127 family)
MICINKTQNLTVADNVKKAVGLKDRMIGLLGRRTIAYGEGLLIAKCAQVHTMFMHFTIDAFFLDGKNRVLRYVTLKPFRISPLVFGSKSVLELKAEMAKGKIKKGDILEFTN